MPKPVPRTSLLTTKLSIPIIRPDLVARPRLMQLLDACLHSKLTLLSAPAGFGKTTLAASWARASSIPTGWVSLDEQDNDPVLFFTYLFSALHMAAAVGEAGLVSLSSLPIPELTSLLAAWINEIAQFEHPLILVLDDYHLVENQAIHNHLAYVLANSPPNLHIILLARADPPLHLARLRGLGQLVEIREANLRFVEEEASEFFQTCTGLSLNKNEIATLYHRTEGWVVGLQLAGLALQGRKDITAFIRGFTGGHHFIIDYLSEEVYNCQSDEVKEFLIRTCILDRMCASLCDAVTETSSSDTMLHLLEQSNLFVIPLDDERSWYRYHRLFSDLLNKRLLQISPHLLPALHQRASAWYEKHGLITEAIEHALSANDIERAVSLVEENAEAALMQSELTTFLGWVDRLPDDLVCTHPELCFFHAWALLMSGSSLSIVEQRLKYTSGAQEINAMMPGRMTALQAYLHLFQGEILRASKLSHQALQQLPEQDYFLRSIMNWIIGQVDLVDTDPQIASQMLKGVLHTALEAGNSLIAVTTLCHQAKLHMRLGQMPQAKVIFNQALQAATGPQGQRLPIASEALFGLGELEREWNNLERAEEYLAESIELYKQWSELASFDAYFPLARLRMAQGNSAGAQEALETARQIALSSDSTELDDLIADLQQAYFFAMQGKTAQVIQWAEKRGLLPAAPLQSQPGIDESQDYAGDRLRKYEHLILARLLILQGQPAQAIEILGAVRNLARQLKRTDLMIEIQILSALAFEIGGQNAQAIKALGEALRLAEPGGYMRIFLDEGEPMARLLQQFASLDIMPTYTEKLIRAFIAAQPFQQFDAAPTARRTLSEPLSEREQEVLRLLATGMSNPEIADQLVVAVSTVRSHCKSIFGKLGVHSRWDAAQRAKELGLL